MKVCSKLLPSCRERHLVGLHFAPCTSTWGPGVVRTVAGVRRLMGEFIRAVHPDLTPAFPAEARRINQRSLAELNSFVDKLEVDVGALPLEAGPEVRRDLHFFRERQTRSGKPLAGRVVPLRLPVPPLPVGAEEHDREFAAARLIRDAEMVIDAPASEISDQPEVPPLFTQKGAGRAAFDKLWWEQTREEMLFQALHSEPDDALAREHEVRRVFAQKYEYQLMRRYTQIKNTRRRKRKLAMVEAKAEAKVEARFGSRPSAKLPEEDSLGEEAQNESRLRVLQSGFHPDLVFVAPSVSLAQRREAVQRVCGMNLASDADFWLLENLWKAMRETPPPVPLVIASDGDYKAHIEMGFVQVPCNFTVAGLCDVLEEQLDDVRAGLVSRRRAWVDCHPRPPPPEEPRVRLLPARRYGSGNTLADEEDGWDSDEGSDHDDD